MITILTEDKTLIVGLTAANLARMPAEPITFVFPSPRTIGSFCIVTGETKVDILEILSKAGLEIAPYHLEEARRDPL